VDETMTAITAKRILEQIFLQRQARVDRLLVLEKNLNLSLPNGHRGLEVLRRTGDSVEPGLGRDESDVATMMRKFDVVDRNLIRSASMKVIAMIQHEVSGKYEVGGLGADASREPRTDPAGSAESDGPDVTGGSEEV
jgi:hypothetical protein